MIPENKKSAVTVALQSAFGVSAYDEIEEMTEGLSNALACRIVVKGKSYLMKIARTDEWSAPAKYYEYMKIGSDAGIAPRVLYLSNDDKISITDFIERKPFPIEKAREIMPIILNKLHKLPPFDKLASSYDVMDGFVQKFLMAGYIPDNLRRELSESYMSVKKVDCPSADLVSCHNDLKPENFIFDGEHAWLVDWEAAFLNDRYSDLSIIANFVVNNEDDELRYLKIYFGKEPDEYIRARFFISRQLLHMNYAATFIYFAAKNIPIKIDGAVTDFRDFHERIWSGKIDLADDKNKLQYAIVHLNQFLSNIRAKRFQDSLRIISENRCC